MQAVISDPAPPDSGSVEYALTLPQNGTAGVPVTLQIDLANGAVAPSAGYEFDLSTSAQGAFAANPLFMAQGASRAVTNYTGSAAGDHTLYAQGTCRLWWPRTARM